MSSELPSKLTSHSHIRLLKGEAYLPKIIDPLNSYQAQYNSHESRHEFTYEFCRIEIYAAYSGYRVSLLE